MASGEEHPWPVVVSGDGIRPSIVLRPLGRSDRGQWQALRQANADYVARWEPTPPDGQVPTVRFWRYVQNLNRDARSGLTRPWAIELAGELVGQVHLFGVMRGSLQSAAAGYWVSQARAGQGVATRALAAATTYALGSFGLHRVEVNIRPENAASLRVVEHLRFRDEGVREHFLHIEGAWRHHRTFALTREDTGGLPVLSRWQQTR